MKESANMNHCFNCGTAKFDNKAYCEKCEKQMASVPVPVDGGIDELIKWVRTRMEDYKPGATRKNLYNVILKAQEIKAKNLTPSGEAEDFEAEVRDIAGIAWKGAANAFRMYPNNKHTFVGYWDAAKDQFSEFIKGKRLSLNQHKAEGVKQKCNICHGDGFIKMFDRQTDGTFEEDCAFCEGTGYRINHPKSSPIDPLSAREIAEKAWEACIHRNVLPNKYPDAPNLTNYLDKAHPLPSPIHETDK